jgi:serine/threonine-protein kinase TTK/MPS1
VLKQFVERDENSRSGFSLDPHLIKHYWKEMIKAVNEIHELDVVHSDLKPVNFIIVAGKLKLIDFGIANAIESDHTSVFKDNQIGTINYMAPEALQSRSDVERPFGFSSNKPIIKFNCKADIWSLGCILYNLVYGRPPFGHLPTLYAKIHAICSNKERIDFPAHDDVHLIDCLKRCLDRDPKKRPTAKELLQHPYLTAGLAKSSASSSSSSSAHLVANPQQQQLIHQISSLTPNRMQVLTRVSVFFMHPHQILVNIISFSRLL